MTVKTARTYTLDELKVKCQKALADPKLVEIVKTAPLNKDGKVNLSHAYDKAFEYVYGETKDLKKAKELAVAARFLAMLRRASQEEFEKLVAQEKQPESNAKLETGKEPFREFGFRIRTHQFLGVLLPALFDTADSTWKRILLNDLIRFLEEKFGLKIKVCGNCKYIRKYIEIGTPMGHCNNVSTRLIRDCFCSCGDWIPKEVTEKPSSA